MISKLTRRQFSEMMRVYRTYEGIMSDEEMCEEFGFPLDRIKKIHTHKRAFNHCLCWSCKFACDATKCIYVASCIGYGRYPKYYPDTEVSKKGRILTCSHYEEG